MKKVILFILLLFFSISVQAKVQYVSKTIEIYSSPTDTKLSGKVLTTTPLEVLKVEGDKALVKITGWNQGEVKRMVYFSKGTRIISAVFSKKAQYQHKILESDSIGETLWHKVELITWVENKNLIDNIEPLFAEAKNLMETNCGLCHAVHPTHEFSANQWPAVIKGMAPRTPMSKDQILLISQYAQKHSKD